MPKFIFRSPYIAFEEYIVEADDGEQAKQILEIDSVLYYSDEQKNYDTYSLEDYFKDQNTECPKYNRFELVDEEDIEETIED
jgi:hypothetical protein